MKSQFIAVLLLLLSAPSAVRAQLEVLGDPAPQAVFAGERREVRVAIRNRTSRTVETDFRFQLYQAAAVTAIPLGEPKRWKHMEILPNQEVLEFALLDLPVVRTGTRFIIEWLNETNEALGRSDLMVFPTNLLEGLRPLAGGKPIGVLGARGELKTLLVRQNIACEDIGDVSVSGFSGHLLLVMPEDTAAKPRASLGRELAALARTGVSAVWVRPSSSPAPDVQPLVYTCRIGRGAVTIVRPSVVSNLQTSPLAQLNLIRAASLAVEPDLLSMADELH